jgi:beta-lactamase superfamily II metal-dependent hydrolase
VAHWHKVRLKDDSVAHWYKVRLGDGTEGFVQKSWTRWVAASPQPLNEKAGSVVPSERVVSSVRVRAKASRNTDIVDRLYPGQSARYLDSVAQWYKVRLSDGTEGFVQKSWTRWISDAPQPPDADTATVVPSERVVSAVRVRAEPSLNADILGRLYPGQSASYLDSVPLWYQVRLGDGTEGFVHKNWTRWISDAPQPIETHFSDVGQNASAASETHLGDVGQNANVATVVPSDRVVSSVRVRAEASLNADIVGRFSPGQSAKYLDEVPLWYKVRLGDGTEGFVQKSWTHRIADSPKELEVHFIDVGQGDSTLVICPNGENILVDAGSLSGAPVDSIRDYILGILNRHQRRIDTLIITHPESDHYNLLPRILNDIPISWILMGGKREDYNSDFRTWLDSLTTSIIDVLQSDDYDSESRPNSIIYCGDASVYILAASIDSNFSREKTMSVVLMVRYGDFEVILSGDATKDAESEILNRYSHDWLDSDVLKIGNHGSLATSTTPEWAQAVNPQTAVVSAAFLNRQGHPSLEIIERLDDYTTDTAPPHEIWAATGADDNYIWHNLENYTENIYSTAVSGNVVIISGGDGYTVKTFHFEE